LALGGSLDPAYAKGKKRAPRPDRYASIVVDANSDDILYTRQADTLRYPASLTKMMTLYMTFEALESGELALDQVLTASSRAARQAPSKLELRTDDKILVDDAIRAVVTKSANDAAVVLAEQIGGSEKEFARLMTEKAHALGMSRTTFKNASGLPNPGQRTTARDLATLGIALKRDFPQYFTYFATPNFTWAGVTYPNHNKLLTQYEGTTGLKTGYTSASGFNLAASVSREGHDLVAVVLGGRSARARDQHMMQLLDVQFARLKSGGPLVADAGPAPASPPDPKARLPAADSVPKSRAVVVAQAGANPRPRPDAGKAVQPALVASADPIGDTIAALTEGTTQGAPIEIGQGDTDDEDPKPTLDSRDASVIDWLGGNQAWGIQIGAFVAMESAAARLSAASALAPDYLAKATPAILPAANGSSTLYRARFGPFDETQAQAACEALSRRGITCQTVHDTN
jgi:D-alanyl-D-alanine carboxypeptidase